jgi:hypothetical protein
MAIIEATELEETPEELAERKAWAIQAAQQEYDQVTEMRRQGYVQTSDPIFMQYQRGEATEKEWLAAVQAVKDANPYPVRAS